MRRCTQPRRTHVPKQVRHRMHPGAHCAHRTQAQSALSSCPAGTMRGPKTLHARALWALTPGMLRAPPKHYAHTPMGVTRASQGTACAPKALRVLRVLSFMYGVCCNDLEDLLLPPTI